jgi:integrase/recombinase XerD
MKFRLVIRENRVKVNGMTSVLLRISNKRIDRYINTDVDCYPIDWCSESEQIISGYYEGKELEDKNKEIMSIKNQYDSYYNNDTTKNERDNKTISVDALIERVNPKPKETNQKSLNIFDLLDFKINELRNDNKLGTAKVYKETRNSIKTYNKTEKLDLTKINMEWLKGYETHLKNRGCKISGISVKMRAIRTIYRGAIATDLISLDLYPFGGKYQIKSETGYKPRPISVEDIQAIKELDTDFYPELKLAKDLFLFSYYAAGINYKDIMLLKHSNISKDYILSYIRSKTKNPLAFELHMEAIKIVKHYQNNKINTEYLFPILLNDNMTAQQIFNRKHKTLSKFNKDLKEIGRLCNIDIDLSSYTARHSQASNLYNAGVPSDIIKEIMNHKNIEVTNHYLKSMGNKVISEAMNMLK